ncbi:MAG: CDP-alcohol phosphatidyltransferase family protein [Proteobacteria bacterium]|nr:CDP-alcohol phosphatidyltransferase family protein [Pseudomonadota bacterium]
MEIQSQKQSERLGDRRPIAARNFTLSQKAANFLASNNITPNGISIFGLIAGVLSGFCMFYSMRLLDIRPILLLSAAILIAIRLLCNMFDGMVALIQAKSNPLGEIYNEVPDRLSDSASLIGLGYIFPGHGHLGLWAALLAMLTAYIRAVGKSTGAASQYCGPMAKQQRMFLCIATLICTVIAPNFSLNIFQNVDSYQATSITEITLWTIIIGSAVTCVRRLWRISLILNTSKL